MNQTESTLTQPPNCPTNRDHFLVGIVTALVRGEFVWSIPSAFTSVFIYYPLRRIERIRRKNIALAAAPALIDKLPTDQAAEEIQKLIHSLYGDE